MDVFTVSHSGLRREQDRRPRERPGDALWGLRCWGQGKDLGKWEVRGWGLACEPSVQCFVVFTMLLCYSWTIPGLSVKLRGLVFTVLKAFEKQTSTHDRSQIWLPVLWKNTQLCGEGLGAMHGHVSRPLGVPELTSGKAPGRKKDNPFEG